MELIPYTGVVWRIMYESNQQQACEPVNSPMGRFHYNGQNALYTSCTEEGASIAIKRYVNLGDPDRVIVPLQIKADSIYDIRTTNYSKKASVVWQDCVAKGEPAPTWSYSDAVRKSGAQGMLYSSRSRPDLTHLVLFDLSSISLIAGDSKKWINPN